MEESKESPKSEVTSATLSMERDKLTFQNGQRCFHKAILDAETIRDNQRILEINNLLATEFKPKAEPIKVVEPEGASV